MQELSNKYWRLPAVEIEAPASLGGWLFFNNRRWFWRLPPGVSLSGTPTAGSIAQVQPLGAPLLLPGLMAQVFAAPLNRPAKTPIKFRLLLLSPELRLPEVRLCQLLHVGAGHCWRRPLSKEQWRRLLLALRYGSGVSTVSSAVAEVSG